MIDSRIFESMLRGPAAPDATRDALIGLNRLARRIVERELLAEEAPAAPGEAEWEGEVARQLQALRKGAERSRHLD